MSLVVDVVVFGDCAVIGGMSIVCVSLPKINRKRFIGWVWDDEWVEEVDDDDDDDDEDNEPFDSKADELQCSLVQLLLLFKWRMWFLWILLSPLLP